MMRIGPLLLLALGACAGEADDVAAPANQAAAVAAPSAPAPPVETPAEAALPRDTGLNAEAQAARDVAVAYYRHLEARDYDAAWALRWKGEGDDAASRQAFIDDQARYAEYHATVGVPGAVQGAAGSLYVEVQVQPYGRLTNGKPFSSAGLVTLRRVNDVPGSTAEQRRWRIYSRD